MINGPYNEQIFDHADWLQNVIGIPNLTSDVLLILDCYMEGLSGDNSGNERISYVFDDDYAWARYGIIFAGYTQKSIRPGKLADHLMSTLEDLTYSEQPEAMHGLVDCNFVVSKLTDTLRGVEDGMTPMFMGSDSGGSIVLAPISA
ncbi:hypothetical protein GP486_004897 [Trichoglossum hirsutum]|uniref:Uncharacterized protein n=1 Tax=Trichoglossum hirsutum TaxID=265104 RepID=A0A9P8LAA4_9PEZI|nr:hypothetical protein GP486_004897 [Trichoglossum hirsutum]